MEQQSVVTHTIRQTEIPALLHGCVYKHTYCHKAVFTKKLLLLIFSQKRNILKRWSIDDLSSFFLSPVKLCIGGLRHIAVS
jgi:hypothetical protein